MNETRVSVTLERAGKATTVEGSRVAFSPHLSFLYDGNQEDLDCLRAIASAVSDKPGLALYGRRKFIDYLRRAAPDIEGRLVGCVYVDDSDEAASGYGISTVRQVALPAGAKTVLICETHYLHRFQMRAHIPDGVTVVDPTILAECAPHLIPARGWSPVPNHIYPLNIPEIRFLPEQDFVIIDCPSRNLALMPNGLGYLNNALKKTSVKYQIFDLDIVAYHRFHCHRLFDRRGQIVLPSGRILPEDPWLAENYDVWATSSEHASERNAGSEVIEFFLPLIDETIERLAEAKPKVLGLSIQQCNEAVSRAIARGAKKRLPDLIVVVGGFSCYNADIGLKAFPDADYMCIGEADMTVGPLLEDLAVGKRPRNQPGILSVFDTPGYRYIPAPMIHDLDKIEFPKYEWCDLDLYRNFNDYQLTPIIASRGCRWSRCTFCAERFYWRIRTPENFADELEWLVDQGCHLFMFNESDLNGMPERVMEICDEIIRRGLHKRVKLTGQLRIHKKSDKAFFLKLREANFVALRFGVDAFSANTLRLQKKGYTVDMVRQNLRDCWEAGIFTEVNWVIGIPGETEADVDEGIQLILENAKYIGRLANINPLILVNGGVYWLDPDAHNIRFREPKEALYTKFPRALPADSWYSTEPYIDAQVRKERFERIVLALYESGFHVGAWANRVIEDVKLARDPNRAGKARPVPVVSIADDTEVDEALAAGNQRSPYPEQSDAPFPEHHNELRLVENVDDTSQAPVAAASAQGPTTRRDPPPPPRLVRSVGAHNLVEYDGAFWCLPQSLGEIDLSDPSQASNSAVLKRPTEEEALEALEDSIRWANSRGQYNSQEQQRQRGSYLRADSVVGGEVGLQAAPEKPAVFAFGGQIFAIEKCDLDAAFSGAGAGSVSDTQPIQIQGGSLLRRLAARLPASRQHQIRRLIRGRAMAERSFNGPLLTKTDGRLAWMLVRGLIDRLIARSRGGLAGDGSRAGAGARATVSLFGDTYTIATIVTKNAAPELMWSIGNYNVVKFDAMYYGLPHGLPVDWESDVASLPGVISDRALKNVVSRIEVGMAPVSSKDAREAPKTGANAIDDSTPRLLGSVADYNIVAYEGWVYGMPHSIGPIDLTETDVMEMPGVIRDVSHYAVENEILELAKARQAA